MPRGLGALACGVALALGLAVPGRAAAVTPVEKVIELLEKLEAQVEQEGKDEAAAYDKYACFCKEQVDEKQYQIEKSIKRIETLTAEIDKLASEINTLNGEIGEIAKKISDREKESKDAYDARYTAHQTYVEKNADAVGAIDACQRAILVLKESKAAMSGKTELEALMQVSAVAKAGLAMVSRERLTAEQVRTLQALASQKPGESYQYTYHANDIIATIEALLQQFARIKGQLDQDEFDAKSVHDKLQLGLKNEIKFAEKEKAEKEQVAEDKTDEKEAKMADRTQETMDKNSDKAFQSNLVTECQKKAVLWDQRSSTRAAELTALSEAQEALKTGVAPNYKANKKLVGLQQSAARAQKSAVRGHWVYVEDRAPSFLQLRDRSSAGEARAMQRAADVLRQAGERLGIPSLISTALKVQLSEDHFVKVRGLIKDLIERLEQQAEDEATRKSFCDTAMREATNKRDEEQSKVEDAMAKISATEAKKNRLIGEIAELSRGIADNNKALKEATALRKKESAENMKTVAEAQAGKEAVGRAMQVLKVFYEGQVLLQKKGAKKYVPPNSDREGKTVSDRAPEVFDSEYKGTQDASKGIIGILEVIQEDFTRTITTVEMEEDEAVREFGKFKRTNEADTKSKETSKKTKEGQVVEAEEKLVSLENDRVAAKESLSNAKSELVKLEPMCIEGEETYEERVAKRKQEIESLKEAHDVLEDWNK